MVDALACYLRSAAGETGAAGAAGGEAGAAAAASRSSRLSPALARVSWQRLDVRRDQTLQRGPQPARPYLGVSRLAEGRACCCQLARYYKTTSAAAVCCKTLFGTSKSVLLACSLKYGRGPRNQAKSWASHPTILLPIHAFSLRLTCSPSCVFARLLNLGPRCGSRRGPSLVGAHFRRPRDDHGPATSIPRLPTHRNSPPARARARATRDAPCPSQRWITAQRRVEEPGLRLPSPTRPGMEAFSRHPTRPLREQKLSA